MTIVVSKKSSLHVALHVKTEHLQGIVLVWKCWLVLWQWMCIKHSRMNPKHKFTGVVNSIVSYCIFMHQKLLLEMVVIVRIGQASMTQPLLYTILERT